MQQVFTVGEVPELTVGQQIIYVDFDGELTSYNGEILTVDSVEVSKSGLSTERIESIISSLNSRYADTNVTFVAEKPCGKEYSTVFVGMTDAFSQYGDFAGLAETVDIGNQNKTDNAFVLLDSSYSDEEIITIISHETDHLTGSLSHAGNGISKYAYKYYYNQTYKGDLTDDLRLFRYAYNYIEVDEPPYITNYYYSNAENIRVKQGGDLRVSSGAVVNLAEIYANGRIYTSNGSLIKNVTIYDQGALFVHGVASNVFISSGGTARAGIEEGTITDAIIYSGGLLEVDRAKGTNITVKSGGKLEVGSYYGDEGVSVVNDVFVFSGGDVECYNDGVMYGLTLCSGALLDIDGTFANSYIQSGAVVNGIDILKDNDCKDGVHLVSGLLQNEGHGYLSGGHIFTSITLKDKSRFYVSSGAAAFNVILSSRGSMYVRFGGVATSNTVSGGYMDVGGVATSNTVNSGGYMYVGGVATSNTVNSGGSMWVNSVGVATSNTVSGGVVAVHSGGVATSNTVNSGGFMRVYHGGEVTSNTVNSGGDMWVDGVATSNTVNSGGSMRVNSGGAATNNTVSCGSMTVYSGGVATSNTINSGGLMYVRGVATSNTVNSGGSMRVYSGGVATSNTVSGGVVAVYSGGKTDKNWIQDKGTVQVYSGGFANDVDVFSGGSLVVKAGATAEEIYAAWGAKLDFEVGSGAVVDGLYAGGIVSIKDDTLDDYTIYSGCRIRACENSIIKEIEIMSGGVMQMDDHSSYYGHIQLSPGATLVAEDDATFYFDLSESGKENYPFINDYSLISGNPEIVVTVTSDIDEGVYNIAANADDFSGYITIRGAGISDSWISVGQTLSFTYSEKDYTLILEDSMLSLEITSPDPGGGGGGGSHIITPWKAVRVFKDGTLVKDANTITGEVLASTLNDTMYVFSGGVASDTRILYGGTVFASGGGLVKDVDVENGGYLYAAGREDLEMYEALYAVVSNATIHEDANATLIGAEVYNMVVSAGGSVYIGCQENISMFDVPARLYGGTVKAGGELTIGSLVELWGYFVFGGTITVNGWAEVWGSITLDVSNRSVSAGVIIDNISDLTLSAGSQYSIKVNAEQAYGTYMLAGNAAYFNETISVGDGNAQYGTLAVNGSAVVHNGISYSLELSNGNLMLSVAEAATEAPITNLLTNGVSQILAWDSEQGKVGYMATDGNVRPAWRGVWEWSGDEADLWRVAGVGHFKGSDVDYDGVLLYNGVGNRFAAWTDLRKGSYGYVNLCKVDGSFNTQCLANLDGDEYDDILIYDTNGSIGVVLGGTTYKDIFHVNEGDFATWTIEGAGSFDDGMDKLVMVNNYNHQVYLWTNQDTSFATWNWKTQSVGKLESGWEVAAVGDFEGDGIDDIMVLDRNTNNVWIWDDGNSQTKRWRGTLGEGFEIEAAGDYNGDGCADLLLREYNSGWGGIGYWGNGYAGNWVDFVARIETDLRNSFDVIA